MKKTFLILFAFATTLTLSFGQTNYVESAKKTLTKLINYWNIQNEVPTDTLSQWAIWLSEAEDQNKKLPERMAKYKVLYSSMYRAFKGESGQYKSIFIDQGRLAQIAALSNDKPLEFISGTKFSGNTDLGRIDKIGSGPTAMLVLPSFEYNVSYFNNLMKESEQECTFYSVTYPGIDGTLPYALGQKRNFAGMPWHTNLVTNIIQQVISKNKIASFYIVAHNHSLELAILIAKAKPEMVKGIVFLNGSTFKMLVIGNGFTVTPASASAPTQEKRMQIINGDFPMEDLIPAKSYFNFNSYESVQTIDRNLSVKQLTQTQSRNDLYAVGNYIHETMALDARDALIKMKIPVLEILPKHDELSPFVVFNRRNIQNRRKYHKTNPNIQATLIDGRDLFFHEFPERVAPFIRKFIKGQLIKDELVPTHEVNESPAAKIIQTFSNTDVTVAYYRPSVKGREIFGSVVPYGQVWRAGANAATEISVSRDVLINGKRLAKGTYCFFVIPKADQWMLVFNSITDQYGAFAYDSAFDVLRIPVKLQQASKQELLKYDFENITPTSVDLSIHWAETKATVTLQETHVSPVPPSKLLSANWIRLLDDVENDGADKGIMKGNTAATADGKAFYYFFDKSSDSLWFKLETYTETNMRAPAVSVSLDIDADQNTGVPWYGSNQQFKVDLMISCGPVRQGNDYAGYNGITDDNGIKKRNWINVKEGNIKFYFSPLTKSIIIGVKRSDIKPGIKKFNVIGSVGDYSRWNDDISKDGTFATVELKD
jgi:Protein of unknown function (DUF2911)